MNATSRTSHLLTLSRSIITDDIIHLDGRDLFQKALEFKKSGGDIDALKYAKAAEKKGESGSVYTLGKLYQMEGQMDYARCRFSIAANDYKHREAAFEMIKMLYEDLIIDHRQIDILSGYVRAPRTENEICKLTESQDLLNMLTIGELHLQNINWRSDKMNESKQLLLKIKEFVDKIPREYPLMASLANDMGSKKGFK